jgi:hypothetical protein
LCIIGMTLGIVTDFFNKKPLEPCRVICPHLLHCGCLSYYQIKESLQCWRCQRYGSLWRYQYSCSLFIHCLHSIEIDVVMCLQEHTVMSECICFSEVISCVVINTVMIDCNSKSMNHLLCVYICVCMCVCTHAHTRFFSM